MEQQEKADIAIAEVNSRGLEPFNSSALPPFECSRGTRNLCLTGLAISYVVSVISIIAAACVYKGSIPQESVPQSGASKELVTLILNICVTVSSECLGFIHATSLRWALFHEDQLRLNSNLRLFTTARHSKVNSWYTNLFWTICLAFSYSSASQLILPGGYHSNYVISGLSLAILGVSLLCQSIIASCCFMSKKHGGILSWNSSPFNTALALLHKSGSHGIPSTTVPAHVEVARTNDHRQKSAFAASKSLKPITIFLWILFPLCVVWGAVIWVLAIKDLGQKDVSFSPDAETGGFYADPQADNEAFVNILILTVLQSIYTVALHCGEQMVNMNRDEAMWRRASNLNGNGAQVSPPSLRTATTSWQTVGLLILKPISHWLFGLSALDFAFGWISFHPLPIWALSIAALFLATGCTAMASWRPKGSQPSTWGDVRLIAAFVHDWGKGKGEVLWWGDLGVAPSAAGEDLNVRIAGAAPYKDRINPIIPGQRYQGLGIQ